MNILCNLAATPVNYEGPGPAIINFTGKIEIQNQTNAVEEVKYHFIRSDGAIDKNIRTITFYRPGGTHIVSTKWTLAPQSATCWEAIEILSPLHLVSNHAGFSVKCSPLDLYAFNYVKDLDITGKKLWIGAEISNKSPYDVKGPFEIEVGAGISNLTSVTSLYMVPDSVIIAKNGGTYQVRRVIEVDLWPHQTYWISIRVDPNNLLHEANRENNTFSTTWKYL